MGLPQRKALDQIVEDCIADLSQIRGRLPKPRLLLPSDLWIKPADSTASLLRSLIDRKTPDESSQYPILTAMNRLEHYFKKINKPDIAARFRQYVNDAAIALGNPAVQPCEALYSLIADIRKQPNGNFRVELFEFHENRGCHFDLDQSEYSQKDLAALLDTKANEQSELWDVQIEIAVDSDLLHEPFDTWASLRDTLGIRYPLVLRSRDRMRAEATPSKADWIRRHEKNTIVGSFCWLDKGKISDISDDQPHVVVHHQSICSKQDSGHAQLLDCIERGIAFAMWSRGEKFKKGQRKQIDAWDVSALPTEVHQKIRKDPKHPLQKSLALFYDRPDRNPFDRESLLQLSA